MYKVKELFTTRIGQFKEGEASEAVGIKAIALNGEGVFELQVGDVVYFKERRALRLFARQHQSFWKNNGGTLVAIFPIDIFERRESDQKPLF